VVVVTLSAMALAAVSALLNGQSCGFCSAHRGGRHAKRPAFFLSLRRVLPVSCGIQFHSGHVSRHGQQQVAMMTSILINLINISGNALTIYGFHWAS
jgi:hypothetical protein